MSDWRARRFWKGTGVRPAEGGGWELTLDARVLRTPGGLPLVLPTRALAEAVAAEWAGQGGPIDPRTMPLTRAVNTAAERVAPRPGDVVEALAAYGATDLLCYREPAQAELQARQAAEWQPLLDWAEATHGARLLVTEGIAHLAQPAEALQALRRPLQALDPFRLTALHDLVTLPGSLVLGLAVLAGRIDAVEAHRLARLDEAFQVERWGPDEEADAAAAARGAAIADAGRLLALLSEG